MVRGTGVTQSEIKLMKQLYKDGKSIIDIAIETGRVEKTVKKYLKDDILRNKRIHEGSMIGMKIGKLTVLELDHEEKSRKFWKCKCDCGNIKVVRQCHLKSEKVRSCGCIKRGRPKQIARIEVKQVKKKGNSTGNFTILPGEIVLKYDYSDEKNKLYSEVKTYKMSKKELDEYLRTMGTREVTRRK